MNYLCEWIETVTDANIPLMSKTLGIDPITAKAMANRGVRSRNTAVKFLYPKRDFMYEAALLKDMSKAVYFTLSAINSGRKIVIYSDYDVDGVMSVAILAKTLRLLGANASYYIPHREEEGYGMNKDSIRSLYAAGAEVIIACDNGIAAIDEVNLVKELGMDIIIIDHHEPGFVENDGLRSDILPSADIIIDHKQSDCTYPFKALCAAAICYKFAKELFAASETVFPKILDNELLAFSALATICDIVPLIDENRIIAVCGLDAINKNVSNLGLRALFMVRGISNKCIDVFDVGFIIGPCINAAGRLETALPAAELFLTEDSDRAFELAVKLSELNDARKKLTSHATERMLLDVCSNTYTKRKVYVLYDDEIPESVAGIVAGRIKDATNHPTIVLTKSTKPGIAKGSARSIHGYNMFEEMYACRDLFERFGGHYMAAGLSLHQDMIGELDRRLNDSCTLLESDFKRKLYIDAVLQTADITFMLANNIKRMEPFGSGNHEPLFAIYDIVCESVECIGADKKTLRFVFEGVSQKIRGIAFGFFDEFISELEANLGKQAAQTFADGHSVINGHHMDIAFNLGINEYRGGSYLQLRIRGVRKIS